MICLVDFFFLVPHLYGNGNAKKQKCSHVVKYINITKPWFQYYIQSDFCFYSSLFRCIFALQNSCNWIFRLIFVFHIVHFDVTYIVSFLRIVIRCEKNDHCKPSDSRWCKNIYNNNKNSQQKIQILFVCFFFFLVQHTWIN